MNHAADVSCGHARECSNPEYGEDYCNAYATGFFQGSSADFGNTTLSSSGSTDVFVAKLDSSGNWLWAKRAGGSTYDDSGYGIAVDSSGNAYVTGHFISSSASAWADKAGRLAISALISTSLPNMRTVLAPSRIFAPRVPAAW